MDVLLGNAPLEKGTQAIRTKKSPSPGGVLWMPRVATRRSSQPHPRDLRPSRTLRHLKPRLDFFSCQNFPVFSGPPPAQRIQLGTVYLRRGGPCLHQSHPWAPTTRRAPPNAKADRGGGTGGRGGRGGGAEKQSAVRTEIALHLQHDLEIAELLVGDAAQDHAVAGGGGRRAARVSMIDARPDFHRREGGGSPATVGFDFFAFSV